MTYGVNPRDFGAVGDGTTNDWASISSAFASVPTEGGLLEVPDGAFLVTNRLDFSRSNFTIRATGSIVPGISGMIVMDILGAEPASWTSLSADALRESFVFSTASDVGINTGSWIELRSGALVGGPGAVGYNNKVALIARVIAKSGSGPVTYTLDTAIPYDFLVVDNAVVGLPTMRENIVLDGLQLNSDDYGTIAGFGLRLKYCANVLVINPKIFGTKVRSAVEDEVSDAGRSAITLFSSVNIRIINPLLGNIAWYGVGINGACRDVEIDGGSAYDVRHAVSIVHNQNGYGEPLNIRTRGMTSHHSTKSGFDSHEVGQDIQWIDCWAYGSRSDCGIQVRSRNVVIRGGGAKGCYFDGVVARTDAFNTRVENFTAERNKRCGINLSVGGGQIVGGRIANNGATGGPSGGCQIAITDGLVSGTAILSPANYNVPFRIYPGEGPLLITDIEIDRAGDTSQASLMFGYVVGGVHVDFSSVTICNSSLPDYQGTNGSSYMFVGTAGAVPTGALAPRMFGNRMSISPTNNRGRVTLVGGSATVSLPRLGRRVGDNTYPDYRPLVSTRRVSTANANDGALGVRYVYANNASSFTVTSTNSLDAGEIEWTWEG